jgi:multiple sugar transport system ATP-binding protein
MANVTFEHVYKRFAGTEAVRDFNLEIEDKEFLVLVGPSGSGKSTVLRMLAGLEEISDGDVRIAERRVNNLPARDRDIAMVFQSYALYPHMSVYDNMAFGLSLRGMDKKEIRRRVDEAARILGLEPFLKRKPRALSGGQRQRVALGRAIVREPAVFLFDEPLSNLDAKLRVQTRAEISKLHKRLGTTFVYVTHDQVEAMTMADRIAVLNLGVLQQVGSPQELYSNPVNQFVAGFMGSPAMNFFKVNVGGSDGTLFLEGPELKLPVPASKAPAIAAYRGKEIVFGIRPENIHDARNVPGDVTPAPVRSRVELTELMGNEIFIHTGVGGQPFLARERLAGDVVTAGQELDVVFNMDEMHAFDPETEDSLTSTAERPQTEAKAEAGVAVLEKEIQDEGLAPIAAVDAESGADKSEVPPEVTAEEGVKGKDEDVSGAIGIAKGR